MMQMLDMRTLSMVNAIGAVTVALLTTFLWRFVSREWGMRQWVFGSLALAAGSVLLLLRDAAPDWLSIAGGNGLCVLGVGYMALAARRFCGLNDGVPWHWLAAAFCAAGAWFFSAVQSSLIMRVFLFSLWTAFFALRCARTLCGAAPAGKFGVGQRFTAAVFYVVALIMGLRMLLVWLVDPGPGYMQATALSVSLGALAQLVSNATSAVGITMMLNNRLEERLTKMSYLDGLTGISNRRFFDEAYRYEREKLHRSYQVLSAVLVDIDFFKQYNDLYGHQQGDECLVRVARALEAVRSTPDMVVARYGGEEFVVLLPGVGLKAAEKIAGAIAEAIHDLRIPHAASVADGYLTVSQGVATISGAHPKSVSLLDGADRCLYEAKRGGRNQWRSSDLDNVAYAASR